MEPTSKVCCLCQAKMKARPKTLGQVIEDKLRTAAISAWMFLLGCIGMHFIVKYW
jgi:hypothetical protein